MSDELEKYKEIITGLALAYNEGLRYREQRPSGAGKEIIKAIDFLIDLYNGEMVKKKLNYVCRWIIRGIWKQMVSATL
jgi:hypothetical protein